MANKNKPVIHMGFEIRRSDSGVYQRPGMIREKVYISFGDANLPMLDRMTEALVDHLGSTHCREDVHVEPCGHGLARVYVIVASNPGSERG